VYRIKGEQLPTHLEEKYGPILDENNEIPSTCGLTLESLIEKYNKIIKMFTSACFKLTDAQLNETVAYENGQEATIHWGIGHMADHNRPAL
jgi:hypothetical protein